MAILHSVALGSDMESRGPDNELLSALERLSISATRWTGASCAGSVKWFKKHLADREPRLESLTINRRLLHDHTDSIRSFVTSITLLDDLGNPLPPLPPLPSRFAPSESENSEDEDGEGEEEGEDAEDADGDSDGSADDDESSAEGD